jgi:hypothetical protein
MITIDAAGAAALAKTLGKMIGRITYFGGVEMPKEMSDWQTDDVHRKKPATKRSRWRAGSTKVRRCSARTRDMKPRNQRNISGA